MTTVHDSWNLIEGDERAMRSNAVAPAVIETDIIEGVVEGEGRATVRSFGNEHSNGRRGRSGEAAEGVASLAGRATRLFTAAVLRVGRSWAASK